MTVTKMRMLGLMVRLVTPSHFKHLKKFSEIHAEIMGFKLEKVLNKRLTSMNDEDQDNEDDLFKKLVATELKGLPRMQKYRLKHEIKNKTVLIIVSKVQTEFRIFILKLISLFKMQGKKPCQFFHA